MKLREFFEAQPQPAGKTIGVCFGRFNPPHKGHRAAWETAAQFDDFYIGTNESTQGPKDPLPYDVKLIAMQTIWPEVTGHVIPEQNLFTLATRVYNQFGETANLKVCTDEDWLAASLQKYNGKEGPHGFFNFASIEQEPTPRLSSATALRAAVKAGNREEFSAAAGVSADTPIKVEGKRSVRFFDLVKHYLDQFPEPVKKKKKEVAEASGYIPKNKKEAKDPRWSTALTQDVKIGAIGKNLKALNLAEQIATLEKELLEASQKKITKRVQQATKGLNTYGDSEHISGDYVGYRLGLAVAGANGKDPIDMKAKSWIGKKKSTHPYTKEEQDMLKQAYKAVGASYHDLNNGDLESKELDSTHRVSPVAKPKRNKYGI